MKNQLPQCDQQNHGCNGSVGMPDRCGIVSELRAKARALQSKLNHNCPYCPSLVEKTDELASEVGELEAEMERLKKELGACQSALRLTYHDIISTEAIEAISKARKVDK